MKEGELLKSLDVLTHRMKNPLHSALINVEVLKVMLEKRKSDPKLLKHVDIVSREVGRIQDIIRKYIDFLEMNDRERSTIDIKTYLQ